MKMLARAGFGLSVLLACLCPAPAAAFTVTTLPPARSAGGAIVDSIGVLLLNPDGTPAASSSVPAATSTALAIPATTTTTTYGPWTPQYGRNINYTLTVAGGTAQINTLVTVDGNCAHGYQWTAANGTYVKGRFGYSPDPALAIGTYYETVGAITQVGAQLCIIVTPGSGATVSGGAAQ